MLDKSAVVSRSALRKFSGRPPLRTALWVNLFQVSGDQCAVGGSTINNERASLPGLPDKHGVSFVLSDLPISFSVAREPGSRQLPKREREREKRPNRTCEGEQRLMG